MMPREAGRHSRTLRVVWLVCLVAVIIGSLLPADSTPMQVLDSLDINDKIQHLLAYSVLAFLPAIHERRRNLAGFVLLVIAMGVLLEFGQRYSPGRSFDVYDMLADAAGVATGALAGLTFRESRWRSERRRLGPG